VIGRYNMRVEVVLVQRERFVVRLARVDTEYEFGMSLQMKELLERLSKCRRCGEECKNLDSHFSCPGRYREVVHNGKVIEALDDLYMILPKAALEEFGSQERRETSRRAGFMRALRIKRASGKYSEKEVSALAKVQGWRCFYCLTSIRSPIPFHRDHYVPLSTGGTNEIANIVLACLPCNSKKHDLHGDTFFASMASNLSDERSRELQALKSAVVAWRNRPATRKLSEIVLEVAAREADGTDV